MQKSFGKPLWTGFWDTTSYASGLQAVEVRAIGSTLVVDHIVTMINPALCMGDGDRDGDIDGVDLSVFINDFVPEILQDFAAHFGSN